MASFKTLFRLNRYLFIANLVVLVGACTALFFLFFDTASQDTIEARRIVLRDQDGAPAIFLQGDRDSTLITLHDAKGNVRLQLQGGDFPGFMMKNPENEVIGTFFPLREGGTAIGLGNHAGEMATFIRGGMSPGIGLYSHSQIPQVAMGISQGVPHFLLFPMSGSEGMVIDGSESTSLLFFDDQGKVPVALSRYGLYEDHLEKKKENLEEHEDELKKKYDEHEEEIKKSDAFSAWERTGKKLSEESKSALLKLEDRTKRAH